MPLSVPCSYHPVYTQYCTDKGRVKNENVTNKTLGLAIRRTPQCIMQQAGRAANEAIASHAVADHPPGDCGPCTI